MSMLQHRVFFIPEKADKAGALCFERPTTWYLQFVCFPVHLVDSTIENSKPFPNIWSVKLQQALKHKTGKLISIEITLILRRKIMWMADALKLRNEDDVKVVLPLCSLKVWVNLNCTDDPISALYCCALNILLHHSHPKWKVKFNI